MPACSPPHPDHPRVNGKQLIFPGEDRRTRPPRGGPGDHRMMIFGLRSVTVMGTVRVSEAKPSVTEKVAT